MNYEVHMHPQDFAAFIEGGHAFDARRVPYFIKHEDLRNSVVLADRACELGIYQFFVVEHGFRRRLWGGVFC